MMQPKKKPLPTNLTIDAQRKLVFHPATNPTGHTPFEDAQMHRFEPDAAAWSQVKAWWLAEASWLAYWEDESEIARVYREQAGLSSCDLIAAKGTECVLAWCPAFAVAAFRGTQPDDWQDIFNDATFATIPWDIGHVHGGFAHALDVAGPDLDRAIDRLPSGCRVWFTGHSLGAALATLAAYRYRGAAGGVCTFGSPLVGNGVFAGLFGAAFARRSVRYVNNNDVVTHVPPEPLALPNGLFTHVDHLRSINKDGQVGTTAGALPHFVQDVFGRANVLLEMIALHEAGVRLSLPAALSDHTPLYYVLHCWNDFAAHAPDDRGTSPT